MGYSRSKHYQPIRVVYGTGVRQPHNYGWSSVRMRLPTPLFLLSSVQVDSFSQRILCSFHERFGHRRMRMYGGCDILEGPGHLHRERGFGYYVVGFDPDHVRAENEAVLVRHYLHEPFGLSQGFRPSGRGEGHLADYHLVAMGYGLLFRESYGRDLGIREHRHGYHAVVESAFQAGYAFGSHFPLPVRFVRELRARSHISYGIDVLIQGLAGLVYDDQALLIEPDPGLLQAEPFQIRHPSCGHEHLVESDLFLSFGVLSVATSPITEMTSLLKRRVMPSFTIFLVSTSVSSGSIVLRRRSPR